MPQETQRSVYEWCEEHYPGESVAQKLVNLLEEAVELGMALGVPPEVMQNAVRIAAEKSKGDPVGDAAAIRKEIGDVGISVDNLAETLGVDAREAVDATMGKNRSKTVGESQARSARKLAMGLSASTVAKESSAAP